MQPNALLLLCYAIGAKEIRHTCSTYLMFVYDILCAIEHKKSYPNNFNHKQQCPFSSNRNVCG